MHRLYVTYTIPDARAKVKKNQFEALGLKAKLGAVYLADCYTIDAKLDKKQLEKARALLANPLMQRASAIPLALSPAPFSFAIEIAFLPGVTDNIGHTAKETLQDGARVKFKPGQNVYSSQVFYIYLINNRKKSSVALAKEDYATNRPAHFHDVKKIADSLYNPLIQRATITSHNEFVKSGGLPVAIPKVKLSASNKVELVDLNVGDDELKILGKRGIKTAAGYQGPLALSVAELKAIQNYFNKLGRKPTDIELETLAQTWSEHCKHTIFADPIDELKNGLYKTYIKAATETIRKQKGKNDFCVSVFTDNAGGISFDNDWVISHKVETHNTPSALDPFGGSITGIGGVNRDALGFGLGAKPIANFYGFCLGDPADKTKLYRDKELKNPMLSARRIMDGVIAGINAGGNQSGIPTPLGFLYFNDRFRGKPLVFAGTLGLTPKKINGKNGWEKRARPGDLIVNVGGRVGADGIHGATFASEGLDAHSPATAVQIGDPITQKKFSDAICKEARDLNLYNSITDCGAGGLSSAVGEMAGQAGDPLGSSRAKSRGGCEVNLDKVPLKYPGLALWQIWISESQERMVLAVPPAKWKKFEKLMKSRGVEATVIGKFTNTGKCVVKYGAKTVLDLEMEFLHDGRPKQQLTTRSVPIYGRPMTPINRHATNPKSYILNLLSSLNITSTEFVSSQYDYEVQGSSALKPLQGRGLINSDASVIRPLPNSKKGAVLSYGLEPMLSETDPYYMAAASIDSAIRSAVAAGANVDYIALLDNFCWCSPDEPQRLWQLKEAARACYDYAVAYGTPFISGKDSMHNDFKGFNAGGKPIKISIPPTLLITTVGVIPDVEKSVSLDAKIAGDALYVLGETDNKINAAANLKLYRSVFRANQKNLIASAISINNGGLAIALAKSLMGGGLGAEVNVKNAEDLFSETQGRILVSVDAKKTAEFEKLMSGNAFAKIGRVVKSPNMVVKDKAGKQIVSLNINQALKAYKSTFKDW